LRYNLLGRRKEKRAKCRRKHGKPEAPHLELRPALDDDGTVGKLSPSGEYALLNAQVKEELG
jgi:hypothetical protein